MYRRLLFSLLLMSFSFGVFAQVNPAFHVQKTHKCRDRGVPTFIQTDYEYRCTLYEDMNDGCLYWYNFISKTWHKMFLAGTSVTWATLPGIPAGFADGVDDVDDADNDPTNELQDIRIAATSDSTFTLTVDSIIIDNVTIGGSTTVWGDIVGVPADLLDGDDIDDADNDPMNELDSIYYNGKWHLNGDTIVIPLCCPSDTIIALLNAVGDTTALEHQQYSCAPACELNTFVQPYFPLHCRDTTWNVGDTLYVRNTDCDTQLYHLGSPQAFELKLDCGITLLPKAFLQGPYRGANPMADDLRGQNLIPTTEPYTALDPIRYGGLMNAGANISASVLAVTGQDAILDWVVVELRDAPTNVAAKKAVLMQRDGDIVDTDGVSPLSFPGLNSGSYFVVVRHRNHLGVMSRDPIAFTAGGTGMAGVSSGEITISGCEPDTYELILNLPDPCPKNSVVWYGGTQEEPDYAWYVFEDGNGDCSAMRIEKPDCDTMYFDYLLTGIDTTGLVLFYTDDECEPQALEMPFDASSVNELQQIVSPDALNLIQEDATGAAYFSQPSAKFTNSDITTNLNPTAAASIPILGGVLWNDDPSLFNVSGNSIKVAEKGRYQITCNISLDLFNNAQRATPQFWIDINGLKAPGTSYGASSYLRLQSLHRNSSVHVNEEIELDAGDVVEIKSLRHIINGTVVFNGFNNSSLLIKKIQ